MGPRLAHLAPRARGGHVQVNAFFLAAEARFGSELEQLLQQSDQLEQQFLVLLRKHQLDGDGAHVSRQRIILAAREPAEACSSPEAAALASFFALCEDIDSLRKFAFLNIQAVTKILKKHDKTSLIRLRDSLVAFVEKQPICTSVHVVAIWKRSQLLMQELFAAVPRCGPGGEEELACTICGEAPGQFACLPCSHSFCDECMPVRASPFCVPLAAVCVAPSQPSPPPPTAGHVLPCAPTVATVLAADALPPPALLFHAGEHARREKQHI